MVFQAFNWTKLWSYCGQRPAFVGPRLVQAVGMVRHRIWPLGRNCKRANRRPSWPKNPQNQYLEKIWPVESFCVITALPSDVKSFFLWLYQFKFLKFVQTVQLKTSQSATNDGNGQRMAGHLGEFRSQGQLPGRARHSACRGLRQAWPHDERVVV